ncbi:hypothetical protein ACF1CY_003365 [Providencia rettgeri]
MRTKKAIPAQAMQVVIASTPKYRYSEERNRKIINPIKGASQTPGATPKAYQASAGTQFPGQ